MPIPSDLIAERRRLQTEVVRLKASIRRQKDALHETAAALRAIEAECQRRGIKLVVNPGGVGEDIHGQQQSPRTGP